MDKDKDKNKDKYKNKNKERNKNMIKNKKKHKDKDKKKNNDKDKNKDKDKGKERYVIKRYPCEASERLPSGVRAVTELDPRVTWPNGNERGSGD